MASDWKSISHIRHPWFDTHIMKRKHSKSRTPSPEKSSCGSPPSKRRRCSALEQGFSHLTLDGSWNASVNFNESAPAKNTSAREVSSTPVGFPLMKRSDALQPLLAFPEMPYSCSVVHSNSNHEEHPVPDVKMKSSSWYELEPDRIVITNLDSSSDEDDDATVDPTPVSIHPALLNQIRNNTINRELNTSLSSPPSQALVLFKPVSLPEVLPLRERGRIEEEVTKRRPRVQDDDAMDTEL